MSFESKKITMTMFRLSETLPENVLELFNGRKAGRLDDVSEDGPQIGWTSGRNLLETEINEDTSIFGGHILVNLRIAEKKIPSKFFSEMCRREEYIWMQANSCERVPNRVKKDIKEEVREKQGKNFPPVLAGVQVAIDRNSGMLYLGTCSASKIDTFVQLFMLTTGLEAVQLDAKELVYEYYKEFNTENALDFNLDFPNIQFAANQEPEDHSIGRDFLTWLWYASETGSGKEDIDVFINGAMKLSFIFEKQGATETVANKGIPQKSAEVKAALVSGKKLCKTKLAFTRNEKVWGFTLNADNLGFYSLGLPDGEEMEMHSRFQERINDLHEFYGILKQLFNEFAKFALSDDYSINEILLHEWTAERESY